MMVATVVHIISLPDQEFPFVTGVLYVTEEKKKNCRYSPLPFLSDEKWKETKKMNYAQFHISDNHTGGGGDSTPPLSTLAEFRVKCKGMVVNREGKMQAEQPCCCRTNQPREGMGVGNAASDDDDDDDDDADNEQGKAPKGSLSRPIPSTICALAAMANDKKIKELSIKCPKIICHLDAEWSKIKRIEAHEVRCFSSCFCATFLHMQKKIHKKYLLGGSNCTP